MMPNHDIRTKLHSFKQDDPVIQKMVNAPVFIIEDEVVEKLYDEAISKSIAAMIECGVAILPYKKMTIECSHKDWGTAIGHLEQKEGGEIDLTIAFSHPKKSFILFDKPIRMIPQSEYDAEGAGFLCETPEVADQKKISICTIVSSLMVRSAMVLTNLRGLEREIIEPTKLNKKRKKSGKPSIPTHTVVRIGHVYARDGKAHDTKGAEGKTMPIHIRAGHTRSQHYGPNNSLVKMIYIEPVLVNWSPGDPTDPKPKPKIVRW